LTASPQRLAQQLLAAAGVHLAAGQLQPARALLELSTPQLHDPLGRARALRLEGAIRFADAVEVTVRSGDTNSARAALARLSERAEAGGAARGLDLLTRARALLAEDRDAEALYEESLDHLARSGVATALAHSRLLYGEWLRRRRGRRDARVQLRAANEMFLAMDAEAWANRACVELGATGELARARE
jgi:hypothetical protein